MPHEGTAADMHHLFHAERKTQDAHEAARRAHHHLSGFSVEADVFGDFDEAHTVAAETNKHHQEAVETLHKTSHGLNDLAEKTTSLRVNLQTIDHNNAETINRAAQGIHE